MKRKKSFYRRSLSSADIFVYCVLIVLSFAFSVFSIDFIGGKMSEFAFSVDSVIAYRESNVAIIGLVCLFVNPFIVFGWAGTAIKKSQQLFKLKRKKGNTLKDYIKVLPFFSKDFWYGLSFDERKSIRNITILLVTFFVIGCGAIAMGFCARSTLDADDVIRKYDSFNRLECEKSIMDADVLIIDVDVIHGRHPSRYIDFTFVFGEDSYNFTINHFKGVTKAEALEYMLYLKEQMGEGKYIITDAEQLEEVLNYKNFSSHEQQLANNLFDVEF